MTGTYEGSISVNGKPSPVVTRLTSEGGLIGGSYEYGGGKTGTFSDCSLSGHMLACTWTEGTLSGGFRVEVVEGGGSFGGSWDYTGGKPGGSWNGRRQGSGPAPAAAEGGGSCVKDTDCPGDQLCDQGTCVSAE